jgi:hypothetical protein
MTTVGPIDKQKKGPTISQRNQDQNNQETEKHRTGESHIQHTGRDATTIIAQHIWRIRERRGFSPEEMGKIEKLILKGLRIRRRGVKNQKRTKKEIDASTKLSMPKKLYDYTKKKQSWRRRLKKWARS